MQQLPLSEAFNQLALAAIDSQESLLLLKALKLRLRAAESCAEACRLGLLAQLGAALKRISPADEVSSHACKLI